MEHSEITLYGHRVRFRCAESGPFRGIVSTEQFSQRRVEVLGRSSSPATAPVAHRSREHGVRAIQPDEQG